MREMAARHSFGKPGRSGWALMAFTFLLLAFSFPLSAQLDQPQLDQDCVVSALNRTARVQADGSWVLPNVPANQGPVRVRATCVEGTNTRAGQSDLFSVPVNDVLRVDQVVFDAPQPVPANLTLTADRTVLSTIGESVQLNAVVTYPGGASLPAGSEAAGTSFRSSNPAIASVSSTGLVTAHLSGLVLISALNEGALAVLGIQVRASGDSDGDGLPDDFEIANGLDPNNPVDGLKDQDLDGLSTLDEFQRGLDPFDADTDDDQLGDGDEDGLGTDPLLFDTDGDQVSDGLEIQAGSNPLDGTSVNLANILDSISVAPSSFTLIFNTSVGEASRRLSVTGRLIDGTDIDIRLRRYGTNYLSSDLTVVSFGAEDGRVFAGQDGLATVTVSNNGKSSQVEVNVQTFTPTPLAFLSLPGFANGVAATDDYVYVAAGSAGLHVVDVSNPSVPVLLATVNTPGNANDVRVVGDFAYVADGAAGVAIVDVANPAAPSLVGQADTPGIATDLAVSGALVYVADGASGLRVIDASNPASPQLVGGLDTPGNARGIDVAGNLVVIADDGSGVRIIDVTNPASPVSLGFTHTRANSTSRAADVVVRDRRAFVADGANNLGGIKIVDFSNASTPVVVGASNDGFGLVGIALEDSFAVTADYYFANAAPIFDIGATPVFTAVLNFFGSPSFRDDNGNGVAVKDGLVYMVGTLGSIQDNGVWGDSGLHIGRYRLLNDEFGIAPQVSIVAPLAGATVRERQNVTVRASASDDVRVASVQFFLNGQSLGRDFKAPFEAVIQVPAGATSVTLGALARDLGGNESTAQEVVLSVVPDARPTVRLLAPVEGLRIVEGSVVTLSAEASDDVAVSRVDFVVNGAAAGGTTSPPYRVNYTVPVNATQIVVSAVATDSGGNTTATPALTLPVEDDPPPTVAILNPNNGAEIVAGSAILVVAGASDDNVVQRVRFFVNNVFVGEDFVAPFESDVIAPAVGQQQLISAVAFDNLGQQARSDVTIVGIPDPGTTVRGLVLLPDGTVAEGATVDVAGRSGTTGADGRFELVDVPTITGTLRVRATLTTGNGVLVGFSTEGVPVRGGVTEVGEIRLFPGFPNGNGGFELGNFTGYVVSGGAAVLQSLGPVRPTEGLYMAFLTTGAGAIGGSTSTATTSFIVPAGVTFLAMDFNFLSNEFPSFVGSQFNDTLQVRLTSQQGLQVTTLASVNGSSFNSATGTGFNGMTGFATLRLDVSAFAGLPDFSTLSFEIRVFDLGDTAVDSAALIDNLRFE